MYTAALLSNLQSAFKKIESRECLKFDSTDPTRFDQSKETLLGLKETVKPSIIKTLETTLALPHKFIENAEKFVKAGIDLPCSKVHSIVKSIATALETLNMDLDENLVSLDQIKAAYTFLKSCPDVVRTPTLMRVERIFCQSPQGSKNTDLPDQQTQNLPSPTVDLSGVKLYLKLENMQTKGSFKIRGVLNQMRVVREKHGKEANLITMSAGNYGKAFAHCVGKLNNKSICIMPDTAPENRVKVIESMGVQVKKVPSCDIQPTVDDLVEREHYVYCHPFDDLDLIAGYASSALELLDDVPDPDIVLVCCGGGGFVSGVASAISLTKVKDCRVYAVEPDGAPTMHESFKARRPVKMPSAKSVAGGLAPPYAGTNCYKHCHWFLEDVLKVSEQEILSAMRTLFERGIKAEPSGCAAMAALLSGKVPGVQGKKVVVFVTGGNVSASELSQLIPDES